MSNKKVNDDTVCSIVFGLYNNTAVKKLDLSCNNITDDGAIVISDVLKHNNSLQKLDISYNNIGDDGAEAIGYSLKYNKTVKELNLSQNDVNYGGIINMSQCIRYAEYVDLSGNRHSPWGGYCAIIKHCCVNKLTLYGVKGIKKYAKEIIDNVHTNIILQSLMICASNGKLDKYKLMALKTNNAKRLHNIVTMDENILFSTLTDDNEDTTYKGVVNVKVSDNDNTDGECLPETISLSNRNIDDDMLCLITFGLYNNTTVKKLDLSCNNITYEGAIILSDCLNHNKTLQKLDVANNRLADSGTIAIGDCLKHNNTLKELNLSRNGIDTRGMNNLYECIKHTKSLEYIDLRGNWLSPWGVLV